MSTSDLLWLGSMLTITTGAAVILAVFSITYAASVARKIPWQNLVRENQSLLGFTAGVTLVWCGLMAGNSSTFQKMFWGAIALGMISILISRYRGARKERKL